MNLSSFVNALAKWLAIAGGVVLVAITVMTTVGGQITNKFTTVGNALS